MQSNYYNLITFTLTVTQRWAKVVNVSTTGTEYVQVTKFDVIHNIQYTDCKGNVRVSTESTSTIMETAATSETITTLTPTVTKVIDVIIPNGVSIVSQQAQQKTQPILDEINREVGSLSLDEQKVLAQMPEYQMAKQTYEAGFMSFLGTKFSQEFVSSADGKVAADNLLATIRKSKEHIHAQLKAKEDKVNTLLELVEQDPEIKKRLDEVM